jgi:predicted RNA-binding Zn-ribbon protein involved in translation (DUF1610 family)
MGSGMGSSGFPGASGPSFEMPDIQVPQIEWMFECSSCKSKFSESESSGKTHCPSCGIAWLNQGGKAGTKYNNETRDSSSFRFSGRSARGMVKLVIAVVVLVGSLVSGGAAWLSRKS